MPFPQIDPIAFSLGPLAVRWYGLAYIVGIGLATLYGAHLLRRKSLWTATTPPMTPTMLFDFAFWAIVGIVVGGRLGYALFYAPAHFLTHPFDLVRTWDGGMSFHGGFLGLVVALGVFAFTRKIPLLPALDLMGAISPLAIFLVRIANFINGELFGRPTDMPWGVIFPAGGPDPRHPTQLYEAALEGLILFLLLRYATHIGYALRRPGLVAGLFAAGYALGRLVVETVRLPDVQIGYLWGGWVTLGMVYTIPMLIAGLILILVAARRRHGR